MNLTKTMRILMAWVYQAENVDRYEFVMDKRDTYMKRSFERNGGFGLRLFVAPDAYLLLKSYPEHENMVTIKYYKQPASFYIPTEYLGPIRTSKLSKYRVDNQYTAIVPVDELLPILDEIDFKVSQADLEYHHVDRMGVDF